ncbi:(+)-neomenthol dehydrogenase, partial [Linum perenne]
MGFEICRQLASNRSDYIIFHQLDVADSSSVSSLADFVRTSSANSTSWYYYIVVLLVISLVNNAAIFGAIIYEDAMRAAGLDKHDGPPKINWLEVITDTYELAVECLKINYYGAKQMTDAFLPLLELSDSPRIVSVSSGMGKLKIEQVLDQFLRDFKQGLLETKGWPLRASAYILSKAAMNAYTRMMANKYPKVCMNCVCPGYVKTDFNFNTGIRSVEEGAKGPVKLALLSDGSPT